MKKGQKELAVLVERVRERTPLIHNITNYVTAVSYTHLLIGNKLMIVEPLESMKSHADRLVAIDNIGAGIGEYVLVAQGLSLIHI